MQLALCCARFCWADLVDMEPEAPEEMDLLRPLGGGEHTSPKELLDAMPRLRPATILRGVSLAGLADLGGLLARAPDRTAAAICARLPPGWQRRAWEIRSGSPTPSRAALLQLKTVLTTGDPTEALFTLGASNFAALLSLSPLRRWQTAQLLPVPAAHHLLTAQPHGDRPKPSELAAALVETARDAEPERAEETHP